MQQKDIITQEAGATWGKVLKECRSTGQSYERKGYDPYKSGFQIPDVLDLRRSASDSLHC